MAHSTKPGTDAALALGMMHLIVKKKKHDVAFLKKHTSGYEGFLKEVLPKYTPEKVSRITGLKEVIIQLAKEYGASKKDLHTTKLWT